MKEKIFLKLKQAYSSLGLGDEVLTLHAESLNSLGIVTDDNIETIVLAQKSFLEGLQKHSDKRVGDATKKVTDELTKKHEDELKKKADEEAKRKADEEAKKKAEEEEAKRKADEEAKKKEEEELARKREEELKKAKDTDAVKALMAQMQKEADEKNNAFLEQMKAMTASQDAMKAQFEKQLQEMMEGNKTLTSNLEAIKKERDEAIAKQAKTAREAMILEKAKSLNIPQSRIDEGFVINDDMDENAISEYLTKVANNAKALGLPNKSNAFPMTKSAQATEDEVKEVASLLANSN